MTGRRFKAKRFCHEVHSWVGLKLSIFMSFILITGTLAVFSAEMDWATHASMRVAPQPASERASWGSLYTAVRTAHPDWRIGNLTEPIDPWFTAQAYGYLPDGSIRLIDIDPYTATVRGDRDWLSFQRFFRNSHRHLMLPVWLGVPLVAALSLLLIASFVSGVVIYPKFWRGWWRRPRTRVPRVLTGDLHRLLAAWSLWFIPVIALTGLFYLAEELGWRAPPFGQVPPASEQPVNLTAAQVDAMAERARHELPGFAIAVLQPPQKPGDALLFQGYTNGTWLVRARASYVAFDPVSREVIATHRSAHANLHQRVSEMADPLHFGNFGGLPTKIIWFAFGAALSALSITGMLVYGARVAKSWHRQETLLEPAAGR